MARQLQRFPQIACDLGVTGLTVPTTLVTIFNDDGDLVVAYAAIVDEDAMLPCAINSNDESTTKEK